MGAECQPEVEGSGDEAADEVGGDAVIVTVCLALSAFLVQYRVTVIPGLFSYMLIDYSGGGKLVNFVLL